MATLHLMIGLPCSGKTTFARQLASETGALVLTPDVWQTRLCGNDMSDENHDKRHDCVEQIMWEVAAHVLKLGGDVILDFGCWARAERDDFRNRAKALGADFKLHYMDVPEDELFRRLELRNQNPTGDVFVVPRADFEKYIPLFQPPIEDELS